MLAAKFNRDLACASLPSPLQPELVEQALCSAGVVTTLLLISLLLLGAISVKVAILFFQLFLPVHVQFLCVQGKVTLLVLPILISIQQFIG